MKLALCLFNYFQYGGLQRDFLRIARVCRERGHDIHVFTMIWDGEPEPGFHVHIIEPKGWQNYTRIRSYVELVQQELQREPYDLVIGFNKMPGLDLYYAADVCYESRMQQRGWWHRVMPRYRYYSELEAAVFAEGLSTDIMLISPMQKPEFISHYQTEENRFHLLPPGIARDRIAPPDADMIRQNVRNALSLKPGDYMLLMVGSGFKTKGVDRAIAALAALPQTLRGRCHLYIVGQDNPAAFKRQAQTLGVSGKVTFLGGRPDVPDFLLAADLLVHPAYHENTGTVILEAIVAGLPVLTVDRCGYAHYVHKANAGMVLESPFQQGAFNAALAHILTTSELKIWHQQALTFAKEADIYSMPERATELIEKAGERKKVEMFDSMMTLQGEVFRKQKGRVTQRVIVNSRLYFLKRQDSVGWKEFFKNWLQLRQPILSLKNEWIALERLRGLGIKAPHVIAKGERGNRANHIESFVLLEDISPSMSLEDIGKYWHDIIPDLGLKRRLIEEVARMTKKMHDGGINHRDLYICHFLLKTHKKVDELTAKDVDLYLIDLHRAQMRAAVPQRWLIKDLAALYFSSMDIGLTKRDLYRFIKRYQGKSLQALTPADWQLWHKVKQRGEKLYREHQ